ncbi:MAG: hypothetical protein O2809_01235 [Proteobacteria bacterium]|nr:hypothetical protein [Pseudomonadota bacterium]
MACYDRTIEGQAKRKEIKQRFSNAKINLAQMLFSDSFENNSYSIQEGYYGVLLECKNTLRNAGYQVDLASNTIYLHFIYVGNQAPDSIIEKVSRVHNHFRRNLSGCNLLAQHLDKTGSLKQYDIKTILWYDKHPPNIELGQHIEAKKVDELGNDAITQGCSPSVINNYSSLKRGPFK